eukprot:2434091-Amphidinium_carterae.1
MNAQIACKCQAKIDMSCSTLGSNRKLYPKADYYKEAYWMFVKSKSFGRWSEHDEKVLSREPFCSTSDLRAGGRKDRTLRQRHQLVSSQAYHPEAARDAGYRDLLQACHTRCSLPLATLREA